MESKEERKVSIHPHGLKYKGRAVFWICHGRLNGGCISGGSDVIKWTCPNCNFDLCDGCTLHYSEEKKIKMNKVELIKLDEEKLDSINYGMCMMKIQTLDSTGDVGPCGGVLQDVLREEVGGEIIDYFAGPNPVAGSIPFAQMAHKILKSLMDFSEINQAIKLEEEMKSLSKHEAWKSDLWTTQRSIATDTVGLMKNLEFMTRKKEDSWIWKQKAVFIESRLHTLITKLQSQTYPHAILKMQYGTTLIEFHLSLMLKLKSLLNDGSYTQEDITAQTDDYIIIMRKLITEAMKYRVEKLLSYNNQKQGAGIGGVVRNAYYFDTKQFKLMFIDNATNKEIILKRVQCAAILNGVQMLNDQIPIYNLSYYLGRYMRKAFLRGDKIKRALQFLIELQHRRGKPFTGLLKIDWERAVLHEQGAECLVKIFVRNCDLVEGDIGVDFNCVANEWKQGKASREEIIQAAMFCS